MKTNSRLQVENASYSYGKTEVLRDISFIAEPGEITTILGSNGAGKTTLFNLICGLRTLKRGKIDRVSSIQIGVVPQVVGLFDNLSVDMHLRYFCGLKGIPKRDIAREVDRVKRECGLGDIAGEKVGRLSGGQRQLAIIGLSLLGDPGYLLLDEPTTGLDPVVRKRIWKILVHQKLKGKVLILSTHYMEEVQYLSDKIVYIRHGEILKQGTIEDFMKLNPSKIKVQGIYVKSGERVTRYFENLDLAYKFVKKESALEYTISSMSLDDIFGNLADDGQS